MANLRLDAPSSTAQFNGRIVRLTPTEYSVLEVLLDHFPADVDQGEILRLVWGEDMELHKGYLKLYVYYLRRKLGTGRGSPAIVNRHRSMNDAGGYRLELG